MTVGLKPNSKDREISLSGTAVVITATRSESLIRPETLIKQKREKMRTVWACKTSREKGCELALIPAD